MHWVTPESLVLDTWAACFRYTPPPSRHPPRFQNVFDQSRCRSPFNGVHQSPKKKRLTPGFYTYATREIARRCWVLSSLACPRYTKPCPRYTASGVGYMGKWSQVHANWSRLHGHWFQVHNARWRPPDLSTPNPARGLQAADLIAPVYPKPARRHPPTTPRRRWACT